MSVEASFIDGLLSVSGGNDGPSDSSGVESPGQAPGGNPAATDGDRSLEQGAGGKPSSQRNAQRTATDGNPGPAPGDEPTPAAGEGPAAEPNRVGDPPKDGPDDPKAQIGKLNGALRESRAETRQVKEAMAKQAQEFSAQFAALQEQIKALAQPKAQEPAAEPEPDFLTDPKVYVDKSLAKAQEALKKLQDGEAERKKADEQRSEQQKRNEEMQQQWSEVLTKEQEFREATPDYNDALSFVRSLRIQAFASEFEALNDRPPTQQEIQRSLTMQEMQGALQLQAKGKNPAQWYYNYAKALGYKKAEPEPTPKPAADPAAVTVAAHQRSAPKPDKDAVRTMGSGGGDQAPSEPEGNPDPLAGLLGQVQSEMTSKRRGRR